MFRRASREKKPVMNSKHKYTTLKDDVISKVMRTRAKEKETKVLIDSKLVNVTVKENDASILNNFIIRMTDDQIEGMKTAFAAYDKHSDGTIPPKSLIKSLRLLGQNPTEEKIESILNVFSNNGQQVIKFVDFVKIVFMLSTEIDETIQHAFRMFDTDGSGKINNQEFRQKMLTSGVDITPEEVNEIIAEADKDGDGEINLEEFAKMLLES